MTIGLALVLIVVMGIMFFAAMFIMIEVMERRFKKYEYKIIESADRAEYP